MTFNSKYDSWWIFRNYSETIHGSEISKVLKYLYSIYGDKLNDIPEGIVKDSISDWIENNPAKG